MFPLLLMLLTCYQTLCNVTLHHIRSFRPVHYERACFLVTEVFMSTKILNPVFHGSYVNINDVPYSLRKIYCTWYILPVLNVINANV